MGQHHRRPRTSAEAVAERQSLFRELNERIQKLGDRFDLPDDPVGIVCECGNEGCHEMIALTGDEFQQVRQTPARFAVLPGHESPSAGRVVAANDRFLVVEAVRDLTDG
jgi:hypothetical protein